MEARKRIVILGSGSGTNAAVLMDHFSQHASAAVVHVLTNKPTAGIMTRAYERNIPASLLSKGKFTEPGYLLGFLESLQPDLIILAGFLLLLPADVTKAFSGMIVNIHPSLLPKYGGKGMYGRKVHEAVLRGMEKETGITIHLVTEEYDKGETLLQKTCTINPGETAESLELRVRELEHQYFPLVIEKLLEAQL